MSAESFAAELHAAERRLRQAGLTGRAAYAALCRDLGRRLGLPRDLWLEGPDAPAEAQLERIPLTAELDLFGLAYERFFPEVFKAQFGQFFTPRPLVELMADLVGLRARDRVLDPTCGSGSFLVIAHSRGADVDGIEVDPELVALCRLNLKLHGANPRAVRRADLFRDPEDGRWDVILANPPFSVEVSHPDALRRFSLADGRARAGSDELFIEAAWRRLLPGGRLAVVLPHSVLANPRYQAVRRFMDGRFVRRAVVSLPEGVFRPFGGAQSRASVVCLQKRPAEVRPWVAVEVQHLGYDPSRKVYRQTQPDDLAGLRISLRGGTAPTVEAQEARWLPEAIHSHSGVGPGVPTTTLGGLARIGRVSADPSATPDALFTEIDLADVDKQTGEVTGARRRPGFEFKGRKTPFQDGDILFARMRPNLNNVAIVRRPDPTLPPQGHGSSEWVRLRPVGPAHFVLVAARSSFVRAQLRATGGQTRPRIDPRDLPAVQVPDPGGTAQGLLDEIVGRAHAERAAARRRMDRAAALYESFGQGELSQEALLQALRELAAE